MCILLKFKGYLVVNVLRTNILHPTIPMVSVHGENSDFSNMKFENSRISQDELGNFEKSENSSFPR